MMYNEDNCIKPLLYILLFSLSLMLLISLSSVLFCGCTLSVTTIHSQGSTDNLDENQSTDPNISPNISVPNL